MSYGFFPKDITLQWFRNGKEISSLQTHIVQMKNSNAYKISSTTEMVLTLQDFSSYVTRDVNHLNLHYPLQKNADLSKTILGRWHHTWSSFDLALENSYPQIYFGEQA